jgi:hypothetical protein
MALDVVLAAFGQCLAGVGCIDILHGGGWVDSEQADEVEGVGGVRGFVENAVGPKLFGEDPGFTEGGAEAAVAQGWLGGVVGGLTGDEQVWVGASRSRLITI